MTTQACYAQVGSPNFSRTFSVTATDGTWNNLVSTLSDQAIGLEMPGRQIDTVQVAYNAGLAVWRIQDSKTLRVARTGLCYLNGFGCMKSSKIIPYTVKPSDLLQIYPLVVNSTSSKTNVLGLLSTNQGVEPFGKTAVTDSTATEITNIISGQTLGDWAFGSTLSNVMIQCEDGAKLTSVTIIDQTGGTVMTAYGGVRMPTAGGVSNYYNINFKAAVPIMKGYALKVTTVTG